MDVGWSSDGSALVSASIDNRAIVWDMGDRKRGAMLAQLAHHKHFVQGVAWDPVRQFVVTQSADRTCRWAAIDGGGGGDCGWPFGKHHLLAWLMHSSECTGQLV